NLFLAVKEALNNAAKHSGAGELFLRIYRRGHELNVVVEDDGKGFEVTDANWERNGMTNMWQRMTEVGGQCRVASVPGAGCRVGFTVPRVRESGWSRWRKPPAAAPSPVRAPEPADLSTSPSAGRVES